MVESARAALGRARAEEQRAKATLEQARRDLARVRSLADDRVIAKQELEAHEADVHVAEETANAAAFAVRAATSELQRAEARLAPSRLEAPGRVVSVTAPVEGVVLKRASRKRDRRAGGRSAPRDRRPGESGDRGGPAVDGRGSREGWCPSHRRAMGRREAAGGASPTDRAGGLHEDFGARRRGAARERGARLCRVFTGRAGVAGRRLSSRGPCGHLGIAKCR